MKALTNEDEITFKKNVKSLIKEFKAEIKDMRIEEKLNARYKNYNKASRLDIASNCLDYVIDRLERLI